LGQPIQLPGLRDARRRNSPWWYAPIGGADIGQEIINKIGRALAIVMQNHGVFTIGSSPQQATKMAVEVEEIAKITHLAMLRGAHSTRAGPDRLHGDLYRNVYGNANVATKDREVDMTALMPAVDMLRV
jgi:ribulose-5-phosphate 4-epimerase/fuculose-1-phosphate aldolase